MVRLLALTAAAVAAVQSAHAAATELRSSVCHVADFETPVRCVEIDVPLDYAAPDGPNITLTAAIVPATTARPARDPLFVFAGGPGQAATGYGAWLETAFGPVRRARDVVLLDFRGTGRSAAINCAAADLLAPDYATAAPRAVQECAREHGAVVVFYTHREVVEDIERVRTALGLDEINLWGGSFGTRIAQHYVRKYGTHVRSVVLDGATPVSASIFASAPHSAEEALQRLFVDGAADAACAHAFPTLAADFADPARAGGNRHDHGRVAQTLQTARLMRVAINRDGVANLVRGALYMELTRSLLPLAITEAARGRLEPLLALGATTGEWSTQTMALGFTLDIVCSEDVARSAQDNPANLSAGLVRNAFCAASSCSAPNGRALPSRPRCSSRSRASLPALVISGEVDPVTPPALGDAVLAQFTPRVHAIVSGGYHTNSSNPCVAGIIADFLADPVARRPRPRVPAARGSDAAIRSRRDDGGLSHDRSERAAQVFCHDRGRGAARLRGRGRCDHDASRRQRLGQDDLSPHDRRSSHTRTMAASRSTASTCTANEFARSARSAFCTTTSASIRDSRCTSNYGSPASCMA